MKCLRNLIQDDCMKRNISKPLRYSFFFLLYLNKDKVTFFVQRLKNMYFLFNREKETFFVQKVKNVFVQQGKRNILVQQRKRNYFLNREKETLFCCNETDF